MSTVIAKTISRAVLIICILFSIYLLLNGGNYPGGGFVGGVLFACGIALVYVTYGMNYMNARLKANWMDWVAYGLLFASLTAITPMFVHHRYFRSAFDFFHLDFFGINFGHIELVSSMFFDIGVYFTVIGVLLFIITSIASDKTAESETVNSGIELPEYTLKPKMPDSSAPAAEQHEYLKTEESK